MNLNKYYLLAEIPDERFTAGEKARTDVVNIMIKKKYNHIIFFHKGRNKIFVFIEMISAMLKLIYKLQKNDIVVVQYPYYPISAYKIIYNLLNFIARLKKSKIVAILHDLNYLRNTLELNNIRDKAQEKTFLSFTKDLEIKTLSKFDYIICHNNAMNKRLQEDGIEPSKITNLEIFDYILNEDKSLMHEFDKHNIRIAIAGNLNPSKAGYISKLNEICGKEVGFELYGPGYSQFTEDGQITYNGVVASSELPKILKGDFGLVWDGNSLDKCDGSLGQYLKYNNPHKASLYIASGLPLIVWKESALADFVSKNNIGICVNNLYELENVFNNLEKDKYNEMLINVKKIRNNLVNGKYLSSAIDKVINNIYL